MTALPAADVELVAFGELERGDVLPVWTCSCLDGPCDHEAELWTVETLAPVLGDVMVRFSNGETDMGWAASMVTRLVRPDEDDGLLPGPREPRVVLPVARRLGIGIVAVLATLWFAGHVPDDAPPPVAQCSVAVPAPGCPGWRP